VLDLQLAQFNGAIEGIKCYALVGLQDGYWDKVSKEIAGKLIQKYFKSYEIMFKKTSHLWVVNPKCIEDFLRFSFFGENDFSEDDIGKHA